MEWAIGIQFPLQEDVRIDEYGKPGENGTQGSVTNFRATDAPMVLKEGTKVEFVNGIRDDYYDFKVVETGYLFRVYEDQLVYMDINPLWY